MGDISKKVTAGAVAGAVALTGGIATAKLARDTKNEMPEEIPTSHVEFYDEEIPSSLNNDIQIEGTTFTFEEPTTEDVSIFEENILDTYLSSRIVAESRFATEEEFYAYYTNYWQTNSQNESYESVINNYDQVSDKHDLVVGAVVSYLQNNGYYLGQDIDALYACQLTALLYDLSNSPEIMTKATTLRNYFPEDWNYYQIMKSLISCANEYILMVGRTNGEKIVEHETVYVDSSLAEILESKGYDDYVTTFVKALNNEKTRVRD